MCCNLSTKWKIISKTSNHLNRLHLLNMILCQKIFVFLDLMSALFSVSNSIKKEAEAMLSSNKFVWFISYWISRQTAPRWRNIHHTTAHIFSTNCQIFTRILFFPENVFFSKNDMTATSSMFLESFVKVFTSCFQATFKHVANPGESIL